MPGEVIDRGPGLAGLIKAIDNVALTPPIYVGVSGKKNSDLVIIAATHEFGTDVAGYYGDIVIPERSYLRSTVDDGQAEIADDMAAAVSNILDGANPKTEYGRVGEKWVGKIKQRIADRIPPPNAPSTIAAKGSDVPLIDKGRLRNSIGWQLGDE